MSLYSACVATLYLAAYPWLARRYREGFDERRGLYGDLSFLSGRRPLWVHAVSVGEVQSALPLLRTARRAVGDTPLLLSTVTTTGRRMGMRLLDGVVDGQVYYPWDVPWIVDRALDALDPLLYAAVETEIWPGLLAALKRRSVPAFLVNGRLSEGSFRRMSRWPSFWRKAYGLFEAVLVRADDDMERFLRLGVAPDRLHLVGDFKVDALLDRHDRADLSDLRRELAGEGPLFVAGSTHEGEEEVVVEAFRLLRQTVPRARLVVVPRHPERAPAVRALCGKGFSSFLMSQRGAGWDILVVDQVGVLFDLYGLASGAFVGGSLVPRGGQNLLEPACWALPVAHGPHMEDFAVAARDLARFDVARTVTDPVQLARFWRDCLDGDLAAEASAGSKGYFAARGGAASRAWTQMEPYLSQNRR